MIRQFFFDAFRKPFFEALQHSKDEQLSAIAEKSLKETRYHLKHSSEWVIRLGDGTEESHQRIQESLDSLYRYTDELFYSDEVQKSMESAGIAPNVDDIRSEWNKTVDVVLTEATLKIPDNQWKFEGGRRGMHSEHLGYILADMQYMQRAYPGLEW